MEAGPAPRIRVEVLGPLRLLVGARAAEVPGPKRRVVLALLALAEGRVVPVDHLLHGLWPAEVPESGRQALHNHVSRLRAHLGPAASRLETRQDGYRLRLDRDELDAAQARALLTSARAEAGSDPAGALARLRRAHRLWRGPVLADLTDVLPVAAAVEDLARLRREVTDLLISSAVAAGQAEQVVGLAAATLAADPLREPAAGLLMRALAATGQAPEALRVAREFRRRLADETGLDPSPELGALEREILGGTAIPARARPAPATAATPALTPATRLLGRQQQVGALHRLLAAERLVTLVGPGGVGKTRVAWEIARQSRTATVLTLAPVTDAAAIPHALAAALDLHVVQGDVRAACLALLGDAPGLLLIDNCEHLLDPVRDTVDAILAACPRLSVLATSREPLGLAAEHAFRLAPLPLPDADQDLLRVPSVALFVDRAGRVRPGPPPTPEDLRTIAEIVRRLDGMPLAIELAAGRLSTFSLTDLRDRLDRSLDLLGGGRPSGDARHRTLRATIGWSYQLLTEDERRLFRHLAVFVDGVDLATTERLATDLGLRTEPGSVLARLVDASMIEARFEGGASRYHMLETLRTFGLDRLAAGGEEQAAGTRLLDWATALTGWLGDTMSTEREPEADAVLRRELANLRAAWRLARRRGSLEHAVTMVSGLYDTIAFRDLIEIRDWAEELAEDPGLGSRPGTSLVLAAAAEAAYHRGDYRRAGRLARAGLAPGDGPGAWQCLMVLSVVELARGAHDAVVEHSLAAARLAGERREHLGIAALATAYAGDLETARRLNDQGLVGAGSPTMRSWGRYVAGEIESLAGHREVAEQHYLSAIESARTSGATFMVGVASVGLVAVRAAAGRVPQALTGYREVIDYFARTGDWNHLWVALRNLADLLRRLGDGDLAGLIDAVADQAPDAPAVDGSRHPGTSASPAVADTSPADVLDLARQAIERHLARA